MKIYVEVENGKVIGAYTDDKNTDIEFILCDHDDAEQETEGDVFEFEATNNCKELEEKRSELISIY